MPSTPVIPPAHDPYVALRIPNFRRYFVGNAFSLIGAQMTTYTVAYELFQRTKSPLVLGMVGLVQVIPIILLALPSGHLVDRYNRKRLILAATSIQIVLWVVMGFSSHYANQWLPGLRAYSGGAGDAHVPLLLFLLLLNGMCRAINQPAKQTLLPMLVPTEHFPNAITWNATLFESSNVVGPMIGGFSVAALLGGSPTQYAITHGWTFSIIYWANALFQLIQWINIARIRLDHTPRPREPLTVSSLLAGVHFVHSNKIILGAITLDMFAVLLGGATALLPVFADQVLHVGPIGLAWLRAAPSIGALSMAVVLAHRPPMERAGRNLLWSVAGFGAAIIVFGLSRNFWLSIAALVLTGIFDNVSVVVRHSLVQLLTPDPMRGRVNAVNSVFISSSNELGEFESATTAAQRVRLAGPMWGPMFAVAAGGLGTIIVVVLVALAWPQVAAVRRLAHAKES